MVVLHAVLGVLCYFVLEQRWYFIGSQVIIALSLYLSLRFFYLIDRRYRHLIDSITDFELQDPNSRIVATGSSDLDVLIRKYNTLLENIRQERIRLEGQGQFLEELIASSHVGVIITDIDGRVTEANPAAATFLNTTAEAMWGQVISAYRLDGGSRGITLTINNRRLKWSQSKVRYKGFYRQFVVLEDLTAELLQSEKEAYGRVIRMMSHEVNNSTGAVNSILQTLGDVAVLEQMDESFIEAIAVARERNQNLGRFVANFASVIRVYQPQKQPVALVELAEKAAKLVQFEAAQHRIVCEVVNHAPANATVLIDPIQIEQVLNNVVKNAMESIGEDGRITLTIAASGRGFEVADTGAGISADTSRLVQEALFYSSKSNGQGIGLMLTREILRLHDTHFTLATDGDGITRFRVDF